MIHTVKIDIKEVISLKSLETKIEILESIIWNESKAGDAPKIMKHIFNQLLDTEEEFEKREDVLSALKTLIKKIN